MAVALTKLQHVLVALESLVNKATQHDDRYDYDNMMLLVQHTHTHLQYLYCELAVMCVCGCNGEFHGISPVLAKFLLFAAVGDGQLEYA